MRRILEAQVAISWKAVIILANQAWQPGARRVDEGMDPVPVGLCGRPVKVRFQNGQGGSRSGDVRRPPGREHGERLVDQLLFVRGRRVGVQRVVIVEKDGHVLKAGVKLLCRPPFDTPDVMLVKALGGQIGELPRLIAIQEAAQCHRHMTGIAIHRPPDEGLDVAQQIDIRGRPIAQLIAAT
jgi:hypothetical protein